MRFKWISKERRLSSFPVDAANDNLSGVRLECVASSLCLGGVCTVGPASTANPAGLTACDSGRRLSGRHCLPITPQCP